MPASTSLLSRIARLTGVPIWLGPTAAFRLLEILSSGAYELFSYGYGYRWKRFGITGTFWYLLHLVDTDALQQMHWNINIWTDKEVLVWKQSQLNIYNAITVASAIFAGIGVTALQLPDLDNVHWTARFMIAASMVCGIFSVSVATSAYQSLSQLNDALHIRLWMSRGRPTDDNFPHTSQDIIASTVNICRNPKYKGFFPYDRMPLESSISVLKVVSLPRYLLNLSVLLFIVGFGLYWLFMWVEEVGPPGTDNRNAFIAFTVAVGIVTFYMVGIRLGQANDEKKQRKDFPKPSVMIANKMNTIRQLEAELKQLQQDLSHMRLFGQEQGTHSVNDVESVHVCEVASSEKTSADREGVSRSSTADAGAGSV